MSFSPSRGADPHARAEAGEHLHDADEQRARDAAVERQAIGPLDDIQNRRALARAPTRDRVEAAFVAGRHPATPLGNVEHDGQAGACQSVAEMRLPALRGKPGDLRVEVEGDGVDLEAMRIEDGRGGGGCAGGGYVVVWVLHRCLLSWRGLAAS